MSEPFKYLFQNSLLVALFLRLVLPAQAETSFSDAQPVTRPPLEASAQTAEVVETEVTEIEATKLEVLEQETLEPVELKASVFKTDNYPIDLAAVLQLVTDQNLLVAQSQKNTEVLQSRLRQRQAAFLPNIDGAYTQSRLEGGQQIFGDVVTVVRQTVQPQLSASWTLYPGGRTIYEMLSAKRRKQMADSLLKETYQEQLARAAEEYYKLLSAYLQKEVIAQGMREALEQVKLNEALVEVGKGVPLDLSRAKTSYAQQQSALFQAETAIIQAEQNLLNRLNLDPTIHLLPSEIEAAKKPLVPEDLPVTQLIATAVEHNPAVQTAELELKAMGFDYKAIRSSLIPSVTLRASVTGTGPDRDNLIRSDFRGLTVNVNLLENLGLQIPFRMQESKKLIEQKLIEQKALLRNIESQVMTAYLSSQNFKSAIHAAELELTSAQESYDLAVGRFKAGYGINLDVLDAEVALTTARSNLAQAVLNYNQSQVQLLEALGQVSPETLTRGLSDRSLTKGTPDDGTNKT